MLLWAVRDFLPGVPKICLGSDKAEVFCEVVSWNMESGGGTVRGCWMGFKGC